LVKFQLIRKWRGDKNSKIKMQKSRIQLKNKKWDYVPILQYCDFERGTEPGSNAYNREGEGVPFIRVGNIAAQIQKQIYTTSKNVKLCKKDDILIALDGSPGVVVRGIEGAYSSGIRKVVLKDSKKLFYDFIYYVLQVCFVQNTIKEYSTGVTIKHASKSLDYIKIPFPPLKTQQKIVKVLDTVREGVKMQEKIIELTKELKKSLMHKLFREGTRGAKLKKTEIGEIPEDWQLVKIKNLGQVITGTTPSTSVKEFWNGNISFVTPSDFNENVYVLKTDRKVTEKGAKKGRMLSKDSILVVCIGSTLGKIALSYKKCITNQQINAIVCDKSKTNPLFVYYFLFKNQHLLKSYANTTAKPIVKKSLFETLLIPLPSLPEQREIAEVLQTIDQKIEIEEKKKTLYEELFKSILSKLMTRKIDVDKLKI